MSLSPSSALVRSAVPSACLSLFLFPLLSLSLLHARQAAHFLIRSRLSLFLARATANRFLSSHSASSEGWSRRRHALVKFRDFAEQHAPFTASLVAYMIDAAISFPLAPLPPLAESCLSPPLYLSLLSRASPSLPLLALSVGPLLRSLAFAVLLPHGIARFVYRKKGGKTHLEDGRRLPVTDLSLSRMAHSFATGGAHREPTRGGRGLTAVTMHRVV